VHRDIKPKNIFVIHEEDGGCFVKLLDFGIVRKLDAAARPLTERDAILGSAHYLSPEQIEAPERVDSRADVWSFGVLAYRMLTGALPFDAATCEELYARILQGRYLPVTAVRAGLPALLDLWFRGVLETRPRRRTKSVELASATLTEVARASTSRVKARRESAWVGDARGEAVPGQAEVRVTAPRNRRFLLGTLLAAAMLFTSAQLWTRVSRPAVPAVPVAVEVPARSVSPQSIERAIPPGPVEKPVSRDPREPPVSDVAAAATEGVPAVKTTGAAASVANALPDVTSDRSREAPATVQAPSANASRQRAAGTIAARAHAPSRPAAAPPPSTPTEPYRGF
jgi:serine/threonine-protein kinase